MMKLEQVIIENLSFILSILLNQISLQLIIIHRSYVSNRPFKIKDLK